jgi:hypothetical protein
MIIWHVDEGRLFDRLPCSLIELVILIMPSDVPAWLGLKAVALARLLEALAS